MNRNIRKLQRRGLEAWLFVVALAAAAQGWALATDRDQPIEIESDRLEVRDNDFVAVFSGNVSVVQGPTQAVPRHSLDPER